MRIDVISFTAAGAALSKKIAGIFGDETCLYFKGSAHVDEGQIQRISQSVEDWTGRRFEEHIPVIFIGALGIAVRSTAPFIKDKLHDIPVVCVDEAGRFAIPVLSSHYGGGLYIAKRISEALGSICVMTTSTDINEKFAVDVFAAKNNLIPANKDGIKKISSKILEGERVSIYFDNVKTEDEPPVELKTADTAETADVVVSNYTPTRSCILHLVPQNLHLGVGCKKEKSAEEILKAIYRVLEGEGLSKQAVSDISSIDLKKDEKGLLEAAQELDADFYTYCAEELNSLDGTFTSSEFVREKAGVDNVCERAALLTARKSGEGRLIVVKRAMDGVTVAAAVSEYKIRFT